MTTPGTTTQEMITNGLPLSGKTMLVTGAAKRLGRAIALAAAENGEDVAITYRESAREAGAVVRELAENGVAAMAGRGVANHEQRALAVVAGGAVRQGGRRMRGDKTAR